MKVFREDTELATVIVEEGTGLENFVEFTEPVGVDDIDMAADLAFTYFKNNPEKITDNDLCMLIGFPNLYNAALSVIFSGENFTEGDDKRLNDALRIAITTYVCSNLEGEAAETLANKSCEDISQYYAENR